MTVSAISIAKKTLSDFSDHKVVQLSAALAYNAISRSRPSSS